MLFKLLTILQVRLIESAAVFLVFGLSFQIFVQLIFTSSIN